MGNLYKGLASYEEDDAKKNIFKGRSSEIQEMYENFTNNEYLVCYADSGEGKSSIIEAGLIPVLRENFFYPIRIVFKDKQFKDNNIDFNKYVCQAISDEVSKLKEDASIRVDTIYPQRLSNDKSSETTKWEKQLIDSYTWLRLRYARLTIDNFVFTPVLIFDQFEEVFTNPQTQEWTDTFFAWLQELTMDLCPQTIVNELENRLGSDRFPQISTQKQFKAIFSLRSEYIGQLDYWGMQKHYIPQLKNNRYLLRPLTVSGAKEVITQQKGFTGLDAVAEDIVNILRNLQKGKNSVLNKDSELPCIPALFLSIVCSQAYSLPKQELMFFVNKLKEEGKETIEGLIGQFYEKSVQGCEIPDKDLEIIEELLVNNAGIRQRISSQTDALNEIGFSDKYMEKLKDARLIRVIPEYNRKEKSVELIHDCLCSVIKDRKEERHAAKQREKNTQSAIAKATLKRELIVKKSWNDYFLLFPLFLFVIFSVYFLLNAVMNEITFYLDDSINSLEQEEISAYREQKIMLILKSYHIHLIGNVLMIVWTFLVSNVYVLYSNGYRGLRFKTYDVFVLIGAITLCYWHREFYAIPLHDVFKFISPSNEWLGWQIVYGGLVGIPLILFILSFINKKDVEKDWKWCDVFFLMPLFSLKATKWYLIILLFVCLYLCVIPEYKRIVTSGESIVFVLLTGVLIHSIFERGKKRSSRLYSSIPVILLCFCLWYIEIEDIFTCTGHLSQVIMSHPAIYYLLVFIVFCISEFFICRKYANIRKYSLVKVFVTTFFIMGIFSLFYIGYLPWKGNQLVSPVQRTMTKWKYYISKNDSAYGANFANGETLVPCVFDTINIDIPNRLVLYGNLKNVFASRNDSLFKESIDSLRFPCYGIHYKKNPVEFNVSPFTIYLYSGIIQINENPIEKNINSIAFATYQEILNNVLNRVKYGKKLSPTHVSHLEELRKRVSDQANSLHSQLTHRDTTKALPADSLILYFEAVVREFSILALKDMMKSNDLHSTLCTLNQFETAFFYRMLTGEQISAQYNSNLQYNMPLIFNNDTIYFKFETKTKFDIKELASYNINSWQQLWQNLAFYIKQFVAINWAYDYKDVLESLPIERALKWLNTSVKCSKEDIIRLAINLISPTNEKERQENEEKARKLLKQMEDNQKEIKDISQELKSKFVFKSKNVEIGDACRKRMGQIQNLTFNENSVYANLGKETVREMMAIRMFCDFDSKVLDEENKQLKQMYQDDSASIHETYSEFLKIQNGTIESIKLLEQLEKKVKRGK